MGMLIRRCAAVAVAAGIGASMTSAQTVPAGYTVTTLATGLSLPTAMEMAPDGSVYITQQGGALRVLKNGTLTTITTFTTTATGERGLLGIALDPAFATNRFLYVYYTVPTGTIHNTIRRITLDAAGTAMVAGSETLLLDLNPLGATNHNGGSIHFGNDGKLYVGVGENAVSTNAQSISNLLGKLLRLNPDPADPIPADNPTSFPGITGTTAGANRAIWAVGLRNPFTFAVHPTTGRIFINDVGNATWEEINDGLAGRNYGWPTTEGSFVQANFPNFTLPLATYHHSNGALNVPSSIGNFFGNVVVGGVFYVPRAGVNPNFPISFDGDYFFGDEGRSIVRTLDPTTLVGDAFATGATNVVGFGLGLDNSLQLLMYGTGRLVKVTYTGASGVCCAPNGTCALSNGIDCAAGSSFIWGTVSCTPQPCVPPTGACCDGAVCIITTSAACAAATQHFAGSNTVCNVSGNFVTPCCKSDFDHDGAGTVSDIFQFLAGWFANDPRTDINTDASLNVSDIFDFLAAWFAGC